MALIIGREGQVKQPISQTNARNVSGFTLIEALIVLVLISTMCTIATVRYKSIEEVPSLDKSSINQFITDLNRARIMAITSDTDQHILIRPDTSTYNFGGEQKEIKLPIEVYKKSKLITDYEITVGFYKDYSADPMDIIIRNGTTRTKVSINGVTGQLYVTKT